MVISVFWGRHFLVCFFISLFFPFSFAFAYSQVVEGRTQSPCLSTAVTFARCWWRTTALEQMEGSLRNCTGWRGEQGRRSWVVTGQQPWRVVKGGVLTSKGPLVTGGTFEALEGKRNVASISPAHSAPGSLLVFQVWLSALQGPLHQCVLGEWGGWREEEGSWSRCQTTQHYKC